MDPRRKLKNLADPSYVTGLILRGLIKLAHLAVLDLAKYLLKKLSGGLLGLPDPFRLPKRYKIPSFCFSVLGTIFLWGVVFGLFSQSSERPSPLLFITLSILFFGLALVVLVVYLRGVVNLINEFLIRVKNLLKKLGRIYRIWFP